MAIVWEEAPQAVLELTERLIDRYHEHLQDARIAVIMRSEAQSTNGKLTLGKAKKVSAEQQVHIPYDFIIWVAKDYWQAFLSPNQREALLDHELSHCHWDGFTASMRGHDVEEFSHIIERYGFWWPQSDAFATAVQTALPLERESKGGVGTLSFSGPISEAVTALREIGAEFMTGESAEMQEE